MANPTNISEPSNGDAQMNNKRRRKKSVVWEHFTIETIDAGCTRARCMQCKKSFAYISGSKLAGTSHLKRHISLGICPVSRIDKKTENLALISHSSTINATPQDLNDNNLPRKRHKGTANGSNHVSFYQDQCRHDIVKMIILHEYPLHIVENPAFLNSVRVLQPQFPILTLDAIERDCLGLYKREKQNLYDFIGNVSGRVNLSLDFWSTSQTVGYVCITGQFIDDDWKFHRKILAVVLLPFPESESAFNHAILSCISDWNLENKLFAVTLDESFANKDVRTNLRRLLSAKNPLILNGKLLIGSCYAKVLGHLAQDGLGALWEIVKKVRDSVKYVVMVDSCLERFNDLKLQLQVPSTKSLVLDDQTQWNTTYHMLVAACELKEVFSCLDTFDPNYQITLELDEWKRVEVLCTFLKLLLDAANLLTAGPTYPTANAFFHEAWKIQLELRNAAVSDDGFVRDLVRPMYERFNRYWKDCFLVFSIAVVMDPRFKMKLVEFSFTRIYGEDADQWIKAVSDGVHDLFLDYVVQMLPPPTFVVNGNDGFLKTDVSKEENQESKFFANGNQDFLSPKQENQEIKFFANGNQEFLSPKQENLESNFPRKENQESNFLVNENGGFLKKEENQETEFVVDGNGGFLQTDISKETNQESTFFVKENGDISKQENQERNFLDNGNEHFLEREENQETTFVVSENGGFLEIDVLDEVNQETTFVVNGNEVFFEDETQETSFSVNGNGDMAEEDETVLHCEILETSVPENEIFLSTSDDGLSDFDVYISGMTNHQNMKPELDQYLEESVLPRMQEFDVLGWWKLNRKKYPILSKMASDILCIPVSTVSQDSVFDVSSKKIDRYRCSLRPSTLEALVCAKDWLNSSDCLSSSKAIVKMEL